MEYSTKPSHAVMALWKDRLEIVRAGKPLQCGVAKRGVYFCSTQRGLPKVSHPVPNKASLSFSYVGDELHFVQRTDAVRGPVDGLDLSLI